MVSYIIYSAHPEINIKNNIKVNIFEKENKILIKKLENDIIEKWGIYLNGIPDIEGLNETWFEEGKNYHPLCGLRIVHNCPLVVNAIAEEYYNGIKAILEKEFPPAEGYKHNIDWRHSEGRINKIVDDKDRNFLWYNRCDNARLSYVYRRGISAIEWNEGEIKRDKNEKPFKIAADIFNFTKTQPENLPFMAPENANDRIVPNVKKLPLQIRPSRQAEQLQKIAEQFKASASSGRTAILL